MGRHPPAVAANDDLRQHKPVSYYSETLAHRGFMI